MSVDFQTRPTWRFCRLWLFAIIWVGFVAIAIWPGHADDPVLWMSYAPAKLHNLRSAGRPVLIHVVADWDTTSQMNKKVLFTSPEVLHELQEFRFGALEADYTDNDPEIKKLLRSHDRNSTPVLLIYPADSASPAIVLSDVVQEQRLIEALRSAGVPPR